MCVIIHKPRGINVSEDVLALAHRGNRHGAGYVLSTPDGDVYFAKGFLNDKKMVEFLNQMCMELGIASEDMEIVFHFRISTAGNIDALNTHPFVVDEKLIYKTQGKVENAWVLSHNGHHITFPPLFGIDESELSIYSDTFLMVRDGIAQCMPKLRVKILKEYAKRGQKYAVMFPTGEVKRYGDWKYDEDSKCYFSNMFWKPYKPRRYERKSATQTSLPWRTSTSDYDSSMKDYVYDDEYGVWYKVPAEHDDFDIEIPDDNCSHEFTSLDRENGYTYCDVCSGNMSKYCKHEDIDEDGYCSTCEDLVGVPSDDTRECDHPRTQEMDSWSVNGYETTEIECLDCKAVLSVKYKYPDELMESIDSKGDEDDVTSG